MPGHNHRPSRGITSVRALNDQRSLSGQLERRRSAESDLRVGEIVGAYGKGFSIVQNPGNGQRYVVRNQAGARTWAPGTQVMMGSFSALPGESILGGPPAGLSGGSKTGGRFRRPGQTPQEPPEEATDYLYYAICSVPARDSVLILMTKLVTLNPGEDDEEEVSYLEVREVLVSQMPHSDPLVGETIYEEVIDDYSSFQGNYIVANGSSIQFQYTEFENGSVAQTWAYHTKVVSWDGTLNVTLDHDGSTAAFGTTSPQAILSGSAVYAIEPTATNVSLTGPPFAAAERIVLRSLTSGAITNSYSWPNTSPYGSHGNTRSWTIESIVLSGGELRVYFMHQNTSFDFDAFYRALSASLGSGSDTAIDFEDVYGDPGVLVGSDDASRWYAIGNFSNDVYLVSNTTVQSTFATNLTGFSGWGPYEAALPGGDVALLQPSGSPFITSILASNGNQLTP